MTAVIRACSESLILLSVTDVTRAGRIPTVYSVPCVSQYLFVVAIIKYNITEEVRLPAEVEPLRGTVFLPDDYGFAVLRPLTTSRTI